MRGHAAAGTPRARRFPRARAGERRRLDGRFRLLPGSRGGPTLNFRNFFVGGGTHALETVTLDWGIVLPAAMDSSLTCGRTEIKLIPVVVSGKRHEPRVPSPLP